MLITKGKKICETFNCWLFKFNTWPLGIPHGVNLRTSNPQRATRHAYKFHQQRSRTRRRQFAFTVRAVPFWNKLPTEIVTAPSMKSFKTLLDAHWQSLFPKVSILPILPPLLLGTPIKVIWFSIARGYESEHPFYPMGQLTRICAGHLRCQIGSSLTHLALSASSGSYCTSAIVGFSVYGNTFAHLFAHYPIVWTVKLSAVGTRVLAVL